MSQGVVIITYVRVVLVPGSTCLASIVSSFVLAARLKDNARQWIELFDPSPFLFPVSSPTPPRLTLLDTFRVASVEELGIEVSLKNRKLIISCSALPSFKSHFKSFRIYTNFRNKDAAMIDDAKECQRFQMARN
ncbi:hypothetical protein K0M31_014406 [Melipona bicolor]|uniref:Uncharacterized protein n=1 Tax=Melipona bicolor TaxID=60889 RepID=A0AA40G8H5_9HYME|nr:hypothetical protein K0M31_014406 [Melipona bicolor]